MAFKSVRETAEYLGMSPKFIRNNLDVIEHIRLGNRIRISDEAIAAFIAFQNDAGSDR